MRKIVLWTCFLFLGSAMLIGQEDKAPAYSITFKNLKGSTLIGAATAVFFGRSSAEVWSATIKMLVMDDKQIMTADRPSGFISAKMEVLGDVWYQFFIEDTPEGASVFMPLKGKGAGIRKVGEDICKGIAEQLPPKAK